MFFEVNKPGLEQGKQCEEVLRSLPEWFGIESALLTYAAEINFLPTYTAVASGRTIGFVTVRQHFSESAEIRIMGVVPEFQYRGVGRALLETVETDLSRRGVKFLQVKTLSPSRPDAAYRKTRRFYLSAGFSPLEEMPELWGAENPCLILVKKLEENCG